MKVSKLMEFNREQIEKNFRERIKGLSSVFGPSGFEEEVAELIKQNLADSDFTLYRCAWKFNLSSQRNW